MAKRGLGKGLEALLPANFSLDNNNGKDGGKVVEIKIHEIIPNEHQPRRLFSEESLKELAASIEENGVIQPIIVRKLDQGGYQIVAGERRWRACQLLNMKTIPAIIKDYSNQQLLEIALIENIQREDLNPLEEAEAYLALIKEYGMTQEEVSAKVGKSRSFIANMMRLLNLAVPVQEMLINGQLSVGHGRALLPLPKEGQISLARKIVQEGLSVRECEALVRGILALEENKKSTKKKPAIKHALDDTLALDYQERLRERLGTKVEINQRGDKGKIIIEYYSQDDLHRVLEFFFDED